MMQMKSQIEKDEGEAWKGQEHKSFWHCGLGCTTLWPIDVSPAWPLSRSPTLRILFMVALSCRHYPLLSYSSPSLLPKEEKGGVLIKGASF